MSNAAIVETRDRALAGIMLTSLAYALFSAQDASIKLLVAGMTVWQVLLVRSLTILAGCVIVGGPRIIAQSARSRIFLPMLGRSFVILSAWLCYYTAARDLQLAELITIYFAAPVIVTVLSIVVLGEQVPAARWIAVILGFVGVFVACDPVGLGLTLPIALVLMAAFLWALSIVLLRKIALAERTLIQLVLNNGFFLVIAGVPTLFLWQTPGAGEAVLLILVGVLGGCAQFALFEGMKRAQASLIAPFEYTSLVWAFVFGYLIWGDFPRQEVFMGAALIVIAGLVTIAGERMRRDGSRQSVVS